MTPRLISKKVVSDRLNWVEKLITEYLSIVIKNLLAIAGMFGPLNPV